MTFRTNQPGSALASLSAFLEQSMQNRAMDLRKMPRVSSWRKSPGRSTKGERKSRKGGRSLVLVLTETSLSNFHFWVVSLCSYLDWKKDKTSLSFSSFFFGIIYPENLSKKRSLAVGIKKKEEKERRICGKGAPLLLHSGGETQTFPLGERCT